MTTPPLRTARLDLEAVRPSHAEQAWPLVDDDRMWVYFPALRPASRDDLRRLYQKWERGSSSSAEIWHNWMCRERAGRALVGSMQSTVLPAQRAAYIAYAIYPQFQRKGYAREACLAVIAFIRETYAVERIWAEMDVRNEASFRLAESIGFIRVAERDGEYRYEFVF